MWHASRWRELRQRMARVRSPIAARLGNLHETCTQRQRGVAGEVRKRQHFVAQGRNQQQINLVKHASHFLRNLAAEAVSLHEVDGREKARLAKNIGPGIGYLRLELVDA